MPELSFRLYDTLERRVKELKPLEPGHLKFYSCGPTVYSYAHIGNFRTFITADLIVRTAEALGWRVSYVSNITDVGHLTQDDLADAGGEDKMEKALKSPEGQAFANIWELAEHYGQAFVEDWKRLNLREPMVRPKATQHIREQILAIEDLIKSGHAYETPSGVYFDVQSDKEYGQLSGNRDLKELMTGVRDVFQDPDKKHPADFALWKKDGKHLMQWYSPWGWGFPGWHIECSVMGMKYLGETLDLHAGGEDLIFPHHECEIAQSECITHKKFANQWVHVRFLLVEGEKMSKSKGNFYTVRDLIDDKHVNPLALRYILMSVPYNKPLNFTHQGLSDAMQAVDRFQECKRVVQEAIRREKEGEDTLGLPLGKLYQEALEAMCDDLNTSVALAKAFEGTRVILRESEDLSLESAESAERFLAKINQLLGVVELETAEVSHIKPTLPFSEEEIDKLIEDRNRARASRDFSMADAIRMQLLDKGIELRDTPEGTFWKFRPPVDV